MHCVLMIIKPSASYCCVEECENLITTSSSKLEEVEKPPQYIAEGLVVDNEIQVKICQCIGTV